MDNITLLSQLYGNGLETAKKLKEARINTPEKALEHSAEKISKITNLSISKARTLLKAALDMTHGKVEEFEERLSKKMGKKSQKSKKKLKIPTSKVKREKGFAFGSYELREKGQTSAGVAREEEQALTGSREEMEKVKRESWHPSFWRFG